MENFFWEPFVLKALWFKCDINLLTFKVDASAWDKLIALIAMRGGLAALYIRRSVASFV